MVVVVVEEVVAAVVLVVGRGLGDDGGNGAVPGSLAIINRGA